MRVIVSISEADLLGDGYHHTGRYRSLCVVLTVNQRLRRCAAVGFCTDFRNVVLCAYFHNMV